MHEIDEESPFWNKTEEEIKSQNIEFMVLVKGFDEIYSEMTRARKSYIGSDIMWYKNFATIFNSRNDGMVELDVREINKTIDE